MPLGGYRGAEVTWLDHTVVYYVKLCKLVKFTYNSTGFNCNLMLELWKPQSCYKNDWTT